MKPTARPKFAEKETETRVPTDLRKALAATPAAKVQWRNLTPIARRDFLTWIDSDKQSETRKRRIEKACSMLAAGKRRPAVIQSCHLIFTQLSMLTRGQRLSGAI